MSSILCKIKSYFKSTQVDDETFRWKYIDLDSELVEEIRHICLSNLPNNGDFFQTLDVKIPDVLGKSIVNTRLIFCPARYNPTHSHKDPLNDSAFALNIPLLNCEDSVTTLYKSNKKAMKIYHRSSTVIDLLAIRETEVLDCYTLNSPILFNTRIFHAVRNFSDNPRLAISLKFAKNPTEWI